MDSIPVIAVSGLRASEPGPRRVAAATLGRACREVGFFHVTGHGIPDALVETLPTCFAPGAQPRYAPITAGAYLTQWLTATYDHLKASA